MTTQIALGHICTVQGSPLCTVYLVQGQTTLRAVDVTCVAYFGDDTKCYNYATLEWQPDTQTIKVTCPQQRQHVVLHPSQHAMLPWLLPKRTVVWCPLTTERKSESTELYVPASSQAASYQLHQGEHGVALQLCAPGYTLTTQDLQLVDRWRPALTSLSMAHCLSLTDAHIQALNVNFPVLKKLDVSYCKQLTALAFSTLRRGCAQLEEVNISHCFQMTDQAVLALCQGCPKLRAMRAAHCDLLTDETLKALSFYCPGLTLLDLAGSTVSISFQAVKTLLVACPSLSYLDLSGRLPLYTSLDEKQRQEYDVQVNLALPFTQHLKTALQVFPHLSPDHTTRWYMQGQQFTALDFSRTDIMNTTLLSILQMATHLKKLSLNKRSGYRVTYRSMFDLLSKWCIHLEELHLSDPVWAGLLSVLLQGCRNIKVLGFIIYPDNAYPDTLFWETLAPLCPRMEQLTVETCHFSELLLLERYCPRLRRLHIYYEDSAPPQALTHGWKELTDLTWKNDHSSKDLLPFMQSLRTTCPALKSIHHETTFHHTADPLCYLWFHTPQLQNLYMTPASSKSLTRTLHSGATLAPLISLTLGFTEFPTRTVLKLLSKLPLLEEVSLCCLDSRRDILLHQIGVLCPKIKSITLDEVKVTDAGLVTLADTCPCLTSLDLGYRTSHHTYGDYGVCHLMQTLPYMETLKLPYPSQLTHQCFEALLQCGKALRSLALPLKLSDHQAMTLQRRMVHLRELKVEKA